MVNLVAGIASIIVPGIGQVINGDFGKFIGIWILIAIATFLTMSVFGAIIGIPMIAVVYIAQIIDAFAEN